MGKFIKYIIAIILVIALGLIGWIIFTGQSGSVESGIVTHEDWALRCNTDNPAVPPCDIIQRAIDSETGEDRMLFSVAHLGNEGIVGVQVWFSSGVLVSGGVRVEVDGEDVLEGLQFTRCETTGCFVEGVFLSSALAAFKEGRQAAIAILSDVGERRIMPISLKGYTAAYEEMRKSNEDWFEHRPEPETTSEQPSEG